MEEAQKLKTNESYTKLKSDSGRRLPEGTFYISLLRDGPLENLWGGGAGEVQKKNSRKAKLNEKKFMHAN